MSNKAKDLINSPCIIALDYHTARNAIMQLPLSFKEKWAALVELTWNRQSHEIARESERVSKILQEFK